MTTLKFYYNGIKASDGKLQKCSYSIGNLIAKYPAMTITIRAKNYNSFSSEVAAEFTIKNDSDGMTDYFENDCIRVLPDHPLYNDVLAAAQKANARKDVQYAAYMVKANAAVSERYGK
jgi:hypothetical protein